MCGLRSNGPISQPLRAGYEVPTNFALFVHCCGKQIILTLLDASSSLYSHIITDENFVMQQIPSISLLALLVPKACSISHILDCLGMNMNSRYFPLSLNSLLYFLLHNRISLP